MLISFVSSLYEQYLFVGEVKYEGILHIIFDQGSVCVYVRVCI